MSFLREEREIVLLKQLNNFYQKDMRGARGNWCALKVSGSKVQGQREGTEEVQREKKLMADELIS